MNQAEALPKRQESIVIYHLQVCSYHPVSQFHLATGVITEEDIPEYIQAMYASGMKFGQTCECLRPTISIRDMRRTSYTHFLNLHSFPGTQSHSDTLNVPGPDYIVILG